MVQKSSDWIKLLKQIGILLLVILVCWCYFAYKSRQIVFDSQRWRDVKRPYQDIRYRMKDDLLRQLKSGESHTISEVLAMLGKPDTTNIDLKEVKLPGGACLQYELGRKSRGIIRDRYYLRIMFNEDGQLTDIGAHPR